MGTSAGKANISGEGNVFMGNCAGVYNTTGYYNVFVGGAAGFRNTSGQSNTFMGNLAGYYNTEGQHNVFIGDYSGLDNTTGERNVFIGSHAGNNVNGNDNIYLGCGTGYFSSAHVENHRLRIGSNNLIYGELDNNRVAINTDNANNLTFYVNGLAGGTNPWQSPSDKRLKTNIKPLHGALQCVLKLQGITFNWKDETNHRPGQNIGFIAQEVKEILPEVVSGGGKDEKGNEIYYSIEYATLTPLLVEAIKELNEENQTLNETNKKLEARIEALEKLIQEKLK